MTRGETMLASDVLAKLKREYPAAYADYIERTAAIEDLTATPDDYALLRSEIEDAVRRLRWEPYGYCRGSA